MDEIITNADYQKLVEENEKIMDDTNKSISESENSLIMEKSDTSINNITAGEVKSSDNEYQNLGHENSNLKPPNQSGPD